MRISTFSTLMSTFLVLCPWSAIRTCSFVEGEKLQLSQQVEKNICPGNDSFLFVEINKDPFTREESWVLEKLDEDTGGWEEVHSNDLNSCYCGRYIYVSCIDPDATYKWTYRDSGGDGCLFSLLCDWNIAVNGETLLRDAEFLFEISVTWVTPSDPATGSSVVVLSESPSESPTTAPTEFGCVDLAGFVPVARRLEITCETIERKILSGRGVPAGVRVCERPLVDGSGGIVADRCRNLCAPYGVGPCAVP